MIFLKRAGSLGALVVMALLLVAPTWAGDDERLPPLKVVYAGDPDTEHTRSFQEFLSKHFGSVRTVPVLQLAQVDLSGADLLIVDGQVLRKDSEGKTMGMKPGPQGLTLEKLPLPTVLIGGMGGRVSDELKLKLGWRYG